MSRAQFAAMLVVVAVAGLLGGALSDRLSRAHVSAQERPVASSTPVTVGGGEVQTEEGWGGGMREAYRLTRGAINDGRVGLGRPGGPAPDVADDAEVVVAREFQLIDEGGNVRAALRMHGGTPCLSMVDEDPARAPKLWLCRDLSTGGQLGTSARDPGTAELSIDAVVPVDVLPAPPKPGDRVGLLAGDISVRWRIAADGQPMIAMP